MEELVYTAPEPVLKAVVYERKANYYETDQMSIVHHSNYIRWFEEARLYFMDEADLPYKQMEDDGILIPVLSVSAEYKVSVKYDQKVLIYVWLSKFNGIRMQCGYRVVDKETGTLCATGESQHCFVDRNFKPVSLKKSYPGYYEHIKAVTGERSGFDGK